MPEADWTRRQDLPGQSGLPDAALRLSNHRFLGRWTNTDRETRGVMDVEVAEKSGDVVVSILGVGETAPCDWGEATAHVFALRVESAEGEAFSARFSLDVMDVALQARAPLGLLVISFFSRFKDGSNRADYFSREFFRRV